MPAWDVNELSYNKILTFMVKGGLEQFSVGREQWAVGSGHGEIHDDFTLRRCEVARVKGSILLRKEKSFTYALQKCSFLQLKTAHTLLP